MYSLSGAKLKIFATTGTKSTIDLSTLPTGTYVVKAGNRVAKVVKQ
ncbi:MAG: T9SS type A sorting domain-containing protein [Prevotellaceae bacterium]|nr:T9SS type A sorting domain-containing protein [Prevotellaceae bacterium]